MTMIEANRPLGDPNPIRPDEITRAEALRADRARLGVRRLHRLADLIEACIARVEPRLETAEGDEAAMQIRIAIEDYLRPALDLLDQEM